MAKFYGKVGFETQSETAPGVFRPTVVERPYYGDLTRCMRRTENSGNVNDDITINNEISILCDGYAQENFYAMRYVEFMGAKWKINSVEVQYPRLILSVGGLYNER